MIFSFTPYEQAAIERAINVVLDGVAVRFAAAEDLIIHKLVAGRPRDLEDVAGVLARRPKLDESYLTRWLASFREVVPGDLVAEYHRLRRSEGNPQ
jgi:predicted nucleotidyltransferase